MEKGQNILQLDKEWKEIQAFVAESVPK